MAGEPMTGCPWWSPLELVLPLPFPLPPVESPLVRPAAAFEPGRARASTLGESIAPPAASAGSDPEALRWSRPSTIGFNASGRGMDLEICAAMVPDQARRYRARSRAATGKKISLLPRLRPAHPCPTPPSPSPFSWKTHAKPAIKPHALEPSERTPRRAIAPRRLGSLRPSTLGPTAPPRHRATAPPRYRATKPMVLPTLRPEAPRNLGRSEPKHFGPSSPTRHRSKAPWFVEALDPWTHRATKPMVLPTLRPEAPRNLGRSEPKHFGPSSPTRRRAVAPRAHGSPHPLTSGAAEPWRP
jgi:hypothetical protein